MYQVEGSLSVHLDDEKAVRALYKALLGDIKDIPKSRRGSVEVEIKEKQVEVHVKAPDLSAARALINSYSYLIFSVLSALEAVKGGSGKDTSRSSTIHNEASTATRAVERSVDGEERC